MPECVYKVRKGDRGGGEMASRMVSKDIITLRGSAAIVSEFFGMYMPSPLHLPNHLSNLAVDSHDEYLGCAEDAYAHPPLCQGNMWRRPTCQGSLLSVLDLVGMHLFIHHAKDGFSDTPRN